MQLGEFQKFLLWLCFAVTIGMFLFVPVQHPSGTQAGHNFIFDMTSGVKIDLVRLLVQLIPVAIIVAATLAVAYFRKDK